MFTALIVLTLLVCVLLMLIVLAQNPKGGGLSTQFGGAGASQLMGVKRTGDLLERLTWILAVGLMVFSLAAYAFTGSNSQPTQARSANIEKAKSAPAAAAPAALPAAPGAAAPAAEGAATPAPAAEGTATPAPAAEPTPGNAPATPAE